MKKIAGLASIYAKRSIYGVCSIFILQLPAYSQLPNASAYVNYNIRNLEQNPKWINVMCGGMRQWNRRSNISAFSDTAFYYATQVDPVVARHSIEEWRTIGWYIGSNYCPDVW